MGVAGWPPPGVAGEARTARRDGVARFPELSALWDVVRHQFWAQGTVG
ncbi:hypothetical protein [Nocardia carnea]|nr:hypothetical protein [Nocardia carnea]